MGSSTLTELFWPLPQLHALQPHAAFWKKGGTLWKFTRTKARSLSGKGDSITSLMKETLDEARGYTDVL